MKETLPLVTIMGPTGIGKTSLAFDLYDKLDIEIISVDSVQIYKNLDIGSGKPSKELLKKYPHKLVNKIEPYQSYSSALFREEALNEICAASEQNKLPLLVGGTMLYFQSLFLGLSNMPETDPSIRKKITQQAELLGWEEMHRKLVDIDPESARRIHPNDTQRIQRALEVYESSFKTLTDWHKENKKEVNPELSNFKIFQFAIQTEDRELHRENVASRFLSMLEAGFVSEVESILKIKKMDTNVSSMRSVGYRQVCEFLEGSISYDEMIFKGVTATRQLAKRQMTWLRSWKNLIWLSESSKDMSQEILDKISNEL